MYHDPRDRGALVRAARLQPILFFQVSEWNTGAAHAVSLLAVCTGFVFLMMRLLKVRLRDIAK
ncbi:hypothetical protein [Rhodovulum sp. MB263]|uniref:hypothetical protein n=1 Tax=Rhodovulum sp. (strain MB263) TaxID=308754 RepID=UPI001E5B3529|nr:hypothetical protein [Rhodovulum sp. MB263]